MGLDEAALGAGLDAIAAGDRRIAAALARKGYPEARTRPPGYEALLRTIVGQQVSVAAAASIWTKLAATVGTVADPGALLALSEEALRGAGLSWQKVAYARSLAEHVSDGRLDLGALPLDDEEAIRALVAVKGIGRWSAEIYLLFAEGRNDIWPAGDLAVQVELGRVLGMDAKPGEKEARAIAEAWRPHRSAAAVFLWHSYNTKVL